MKTRLLSILRKKAIKNIYLVKYRNSFDLYKVVGSRPELVNRYDNINAGVSDCDELRRSYILKMLPSKRIY